jgi:DNA-binding NarL/FixJ family response regulator
METAADGRIRVVLADDDDGYLESLRVLIEQQPGLTVVGTAGDGLAAIELVDELQPAAVVIDLHMPLLDGVSAVSRLRRDHPSLCLIALTGDPEPRLHEAARGAGADGVMLKNELLENLVERLSAVRTA